MNFKQKLLQIALGALGSAVAAALSYIGSGDVASATAFGVAANAAFGDVVNRLA